MSAPLVSIVIPHFNRAKLLAAALASVRAQVETSCEVLVVDDGSEPEQWERTRAMVGSQIQVLQRRDGIKGPSRCRNLGLSAARGEYVLFLDSDDLLAPWCLEQRLRAALGQPEADLWVFPVLLFTDKPGDSDVQWNLLEGPCGADAMLSDHQPGLEINGLLSLSLSPLGGERVPKAGEEAVRGFKARLPSGNSLPALRGEGGRRPGEGRFVGSSEADLERFLKSDPPWHTSSPLWRREKLLALGGFNEAVCYGDDSDLHVRALLGGARVRKVPEALPDVFIRRSDEARITNSLTPGLLKSRRIRLEEGTRFLKGAGDRTGLVRVCSGNGRSAIDQSLTSAPTFSKRALRLWEGQYFVEAEFLLFNVTDPYAAIRRVLEDWRRRFQPSLARRAVVTGYFRFAVAYRKRAYLLLRVARRLAMKLLPAEYFPRGGAFQSTRVVPEVMQAVRERLNREVELHHHPVSGKL